MKKKEKKEFKWVLRAQIISALRRLFVRSPMYKATLDAAKVEVKTFNKGGEESKKKRYKYKCAICENLYFKEKIQIDRESGKRKKTIRKVTVHAIQVDHCLPVIETSGWDDNWSEYIKRMFLWVEVWNNDPKQIAGHSRVLCHWCHASVSAEQNRERKEHAKVPDEATDRGKTRHTRGSAKADRVEKRPMGK